MKKEIWKTKYRISSNEKINWKLYLLPSLLMTVVNEMTFNVLLLLLLLLLLIYIDSVNILNFR
jgi:hypothetical protein